MVFTSIESANEQEKATVVAHIHYVLGIPESSASLTTVNRLQEIFESTPLCDIFSGLTPESFAACLSRVLKHRDTAVHCLSFNGGVTMLYGLTLVLLKPGLVPAKKFDHILCAADNITNYSEKLSGLIQGVERAIKVLVEAKSLYEVSEFMGITENTVAPEAGLFQFYMYSLAYQNWSVLHMLLLWTHPSRFGYTQIESLLKDILLAKYNSTNTGTPDEHRRLVDTLTRVLNRCAQMEKSVTGKDPAMTSLFPPLFFIPLSHDDISLAELVYRPGNSGITQFKEYLGQTSVSSAAASFILSKEGHPL